MELSTKASGYLVIGSLNLGKCLLQDRTWATKIHSHEARALFTEHCTVVHTHLCLANEELYEFVMWQVKDASTFFIPQNNT